MYQGDNATVVPITLSPFLYSIVPGHFIVFSAISFPAAKAFKLSSTIVSPFFWNISRILSCIFS